MGLQTDGISTPDLNTLTSISGDVVYDFETGDTSRWTQDTNLTAVQDRVHNGSYAGYISGSQDPEAHAQPYDGDERQLSKLEYFWNDSNSGHGGGMQVRDGNGNIVLGLATDNPSWVIIDGNGSGQVFGGDGVDRWVRFTVTFDWGAGTFDVDFEDLQSGSTYTDSGRPLVNTTGVAEVELEHFNEGSFSDSSAIEMWFDEIGFYP